MSPTRAQEPRSMQINIALTEREHANLCKRAEALGMRPVHLGRALLIFEVHPEGTAIAANSVALQAEDNRSRMIYGQLSRLGNNLNQLVRHLHKTGEALPPDLEPLLADIREVLDRRAK